MPGEPLSDDSPFATLLDELAALGPEQRRELAGTLRTVAGTCSEVPDGQRTAEMLGVLAHFLDPPKTAEPDSRPASVPKPTIFDRVLADLRAEVFAQVGASQKLLSE